MDLWLALILSILAVYRASYFIAKEDGPFDMFSKMRGKIGQEGWVGRGLNCVLCISFWLSLIPALWLFWGRPIDIIAGWFGISGAALVLYKVLDEQFT